MDYSHYIVTEYVCIAERSCDLLHITIILCFVFLVYLILKSLHLFWLVLSVFIVTLCLFAIVFVFYGLRISFYFHAFRFYVRVNFIFFSFVFLCGFREFLLIFTFF